MIRFFVIILSFFKVLAFTDSHSQRPALQSESTYTYSIVVSFSVLKDWVSIITKNRPNVTVEAIVPIGQDPHVYQPHPGDAKKIAHANVIIVNGLGFEGWIDRFIESAKIYCPIIIASQGIVPRMVKNTEQDPHIWHDVSLAIQCIQNITKALCDHDPGFADLYQQNASDYIKKLKFLDESIAKTIKEIDETKRHVITTHDAFGYYGHKYDVIFSSPIGLSTEEEPSAKDVAALIREIKEKKVLAIFIENLANPRIIQQIAQETGQSIQGTLFADSLSSPEQGADSYIKMMVHNTNTLLKAFGHTTSINA